MMRSAASVASPRSWAARNPRSSLLRPPQPSVADRRTLTAPANAPTGERTRREHVERVAASLRPGRTDFEADWHAIADYSGYGEVPALMTTAMGQQRPKMRHLMDSHPILAFRTISAGMYSGFSSPNRPWLRLKFADEGLNEFGAARQWLDATERLVYAMFDASNFYQAARQNYSDMAHFGPAVGIMTEHWEHIAPTLPLAIGTYWLGFDDAFRVDTLVRDCPMTVHQVVQKFVAKNGAMDWSAVDAKIKAAWDNSQYQTVIKVKQCIEPGPNGTWQSTIWDCGDQRPGAVLEAKSYAEKPFWAPIWDEHGVGGYGRGLGHHALADMRELHMQAKRKRELTDLLAKPPTAGVAKDLDMRPGAHTYVSDIDAVKAAVPVYQVNPQAIGAVREDIAEIKAQIDRLTYADLFMAITNMRGVQPRTVEEILKRDEEKLTQLGPVVEQVNDNMLPVAVERMLAIAERGGLLPPAPPDIQGQALKIEFVSVLAQAQKMLGLSSTERVVGFVGSLSSVFGPQVLDKLDPDALVDDYAERANLPAKATRDQRAVDEMRAARAEQDQMAQMAAMAQPARDATQAAANIAGMSGL